MPCAGWSVANAAGLDRRDRLLVTVADVVPDIDGLGLAVDLVTTGGDRPTGLWGTYHHVLGHNAVAGAVVVALAFALVHRRTLATALAVASFHLYFHLLPCERLRGLVGLSARPAWSPALIECGRFGAAPPTRRTQ